MCAFPKATQEKMTGPKQKKAVMVMKMKWLIITTGKIELYVGHNNFCRLQGKPTEIT
jgi:hypothetical protein